MTWSIESAFNAVLDGIATVERITRPLGHDDFDEPLAEEFLRDGADSDERRDALGPYTHREAYAPTEPALTPDELVGVRGPTSSYHDLLSLDNYDDPPYPHCTCPCINCSNGAHWMCHGEGVEIDTVHDDSPPDSTLDDVVAQLAQLTYFIEDVRNLLAAATTETSAAVSPAGVEHPPVPPVGHSEQRIHDVLIEHSRIAVSSMGAGPAWGCRCNRTKVLGPGGYIDHVLDLLNAEAPGPQEKPAFETGHDMGVSFASELFPQHRNNQQ